MKTPKIPGGWSYWDSQTGKEAAWRRAVELKGARERFRPDLRVRVRVIPAGGAHWILRKEEEKTT